METASLDRLFEVTGAKISCNELFQAVNAYANTKVSLKLDWAILKTSVNLARRVFAILSSPQFFQLEVS